jgi:hypothetical protein
MKKIYSYIEAQGRSLRPPVMEGPHAEAPVYLGQIDGRHYVALTGEPPAQAPEIRLQGPHDPGKEPELAGKLSAVAEPLRLVRRRRAEEYPDIGEQLDALIKELAARRSRGEALTPALQDIVDRCLAVKARHPKPDLGLE